MPVGRIGKTSTGAGKATPKAVERTDFLNFPPQILLIVIGTMQANKALGRTKLCKDTSSRLERLS